MVPGLHDAAAVKTSLAALAATLSLGAATARAGDIHVSLGAAGGASEWRGDGNAFTTLRLGYRAFEWLTGYFLARLGYGGVDERLLTGISVGVQAAKRFGPIRAYLRAGFVHQHEESAAAVRSNAWGAAFGIGDAIRHRAGADLAAGVEIPFKKTARWEFFAAAEGFGDWFTGSSGPSWYFGGGLAVGFHYSL